MEDERDGEMRWCESMITLASVYVYDGVCVCVCVCVLLSLRKLKFEKCVNMCEYICEEGRG